METRVAVLNFQPSTSIQVVHVSQYDVGVPLRFILYDGSSPADIEGGSQASVVMTATRPSGTGFTVPCTIIASNIVSVDTTEAMTIEFGSMEAEIRYTNNGTTVGTGNFIFDVEAAAHADYIIDEDHAEWVRISQEVQSNATNAQRAETNAQSWAQQALSTVSQAHDYAEGAVEAAATATRMRNEAVTAKNQAEAAKDNANASALNASDSADAAQLAADDAEAYAVGTRGGEPVISTDPTYHNNAKYYAELGGTTSLANAFSTSTAYAVDDYVLYDSKLWRFTAAHAAGAWNASHVIEVKTMDEVSDLKGDLSDKVDINQGVAYAGKALVIDSSGNVVPGNAGVDVDPTLSIEGKAADAKAVGDLLVSKTTHDSWEKGAYIIGTGAVSTTGFQQFIRFSDKSFIDDGVIIRTNDGYAVLAYAWLKSNDSYVGCYNGNGSFVLDGNNVRSVSYFNTKEYPTYKFKVALSRYPASESITVSEGTNALFTKSSLEESYVKYDGPQSLTAEEQAQARENIGIGSETDTTLTIAGMPADAKAVGDALFTSITHDSWEKGAYIIGTGDVSTSGFQQMIRFSDKSFLDSSVETISTNEGYGFLVYAWLKSNNSYYGCYNGNGGFVKDGNNVKFVTTFDTTLYNNYNFKVCLSRIPSTESIVPSEGINILFRGKNAEKNIRYDIRQTLSAEEQAQARENIGIVSENNTVFSGIANPGDTLFTSSEVNNGELLFYDVTTGGINKNGYIEFLDANNQRIQIIGKIDSVFSDTHIFGVFRCPESYSVCKWNGNYQADIKYIKKSADIEWISKEYGSVYFEEDVNILSNCGYYQNYGLVCKTGTVSSLSGRAITTYLPVIPHSKIKVNWDLQSDTYGACYYDSHGNYVTGELSYYHHCYIVPDGCYFVRLTVPTSMLSTISAYINTPLKQTLDERKTKVPMFERYDILKYGTKYNGYTHLAFPRICLFDNKLYISYRCGMAHLPSNGAGDGNLQIDTISLDGEHKHLRMLSGTDFGIQEGNLKMDFREAGIQPSRDGKYLLMTTFITDNTSETPYWHNIVAVLDKNANVLNYIDLGSDSEAFYSQPLITPGGKLIFSSHNKAPRGANIYVSDQVFSGDVSQMTFTKLPYIISADEAGTATSETCLGYFNDKLVALQRVDNGTFGVMKYTENLEGVDGWSNIIRLTNNGGIHAPMLLPYAKGEYLPFVAAWYSPNGGDRTCGFGFIDIENGRIHKMKKVDETLPNHVGGYCGLAYLGDDIYAVVYYLDSKNVTGALTQTYSGLYFKTIKLRTFFPEIIYGDF